MKKLHNDKIFLFCLVMLITVLMALGQSAVDSMIVRADSKHVFYDLLPKTETDMATKYDTEIKGYVLTPETVKVTAEGELSDFLLPSPNENTINYNNTLGIQDNPTILIYHTHTTEAYRQTEEYKYSETSEFRTDDAKNNIVAVGKELKRKLEEYGYKVFHDTTNHEPPKLSTSYERSLLTMQKYLDEYDIDIFIDIHRDAADVNSHKDDVVMIDGKRCARMMFVVGKGVKYEQKPNFDSNYMLANFITSELEKMADGFTRNVRVKDGRYNQHLSDLSMLVEIGHNANTLDEAMTSVEYLASAINSAIKG